MRFFGLGHLGLGHLGLGRLEERRKRKRETKRESDRKKMEGGIKNERTRGRKNEARERG